MAYEIKRYILKHPTEDATSIARRFKTSGEYVRQCRMKLRRGNLSIPRPDGRTKVGRSPVPLDEQLVERQRQAILDDLKERNRELLRRLDDLNVKYDEALALKVETKVRVPRVDLRSTHRNQATAIVQFSDWHVEERIEKSLVGGLNEYTPDVARRRADAVTTNTLKLLRKERQDVQIKDLLLWLGGDFINNFIHEAYQQTNFLSPLEATMFAKELLKRSLSTLAAHADCDRVVVVCSRGNHGRLTKRMESGTDYKMNLEAMLYHMLKQELAGAPFEWVVPDSELGYVDVYGRRIRYFHGHQVSYQGGVGDLTVPLNKIIQKWDRTNKAAWNLMGHFHRNWQCAPQCSLNGSLCGFNAFALSLGFAYEPPSQVFQLLDAKRGFTVRTPIFCE